MQVPHRALTIFGSLLLVLGLLGPITFADDLRHSGEIAVSVGFALSGFLLLAPHLLKHWRCRRSLPLVSPFILLGLSIGTFLDQALLGVFAGACAGLALAGWQCSRHRRVAA
jgi:hypothetical protein